VQKGKRGLCLARGGKKKKKASLYESAREGEEGYSRRLLAHQGKKGVIKKSLLTALHEKKKKTGVATSSGAREGKKVQTIPQRPRLIPEEAIFNKKKDRSCLRARNPRRGEWGKGKNISLHAREKALPNAYVCEREGKKNF